MENTLFYIVCSVIILLGSTISAIVTIYNAAKTPAKKIKERQNAELKEVITDTIDTVMPELLHKHDLETREKYLSDRQRYLNDISDEVLERMSVQLDNHLKSLDNIPELLTKLDTVSISTKDMLREKIIKIYLGNKDKKSISTLEHERLVQFYKDYKALNGNSYIDKYYTRMSKWKIVDDDDADDVEVL